MLAAQKNSAQKQNLPDRSCTRESRQNAHIFFLFVIFLIVAAMLKAVSAADSPSENHEQSSKVSVLGERKAVKYV
jgi:hypothetical protein